MGRSHNKSYRDKQADKKARNFVKINDSFSMKKLEPGKHSITSWFKDMQSAINHQFPIHNFVVAGGTYETILRQNKPSLPSNYSTLSEKLKQEAKTELEVMTKAYGSHKKKLNDEKAAVFALIESAMSSKSLSIVMSHKDWTRACNPGKCIWNPAMLISIIKVTHQNGTLADDDDYLSIVIDFKYDFYETRQSKKESLFDFAERIVGLQERDKAISLRDPDYDPSEPKAIISEAEYGALFIDRLNSNYSEIRADYFQQKRVSKLKPFASLQEAREFADRYEKTKQITDTREETVSRNEYNVLKTTVQSLVDQNPEQARVLLTGKKSVNKKRKKGEQHSAAISRSGGNKPTRECKFCHGSSFVTDKMHWDKDCPMMAHVANFFKNMEGSKGKERKAGNKKRDAKGKRKQRNDVDDDDKGDDESDDSESDEDYVRDSKSSKKFKRRE